MRVVFMGTPEFGTAVLRRLVEDHWNVVAVYTQPDKPKNRGMKLIPTPVKEYALSKNIPVYQPDKIRLPENAKILKELKPDLMITAAFGQILSKEKILSTASVACLTLDCNRCDYREIE